MKKQCGNCKNKPDLTEFKICEVVQLYNFTAKKYGVGWVLVDDLTGLKTAIDCKHWEIKE